MHLNHTLFTWLFKKHYITDIKGYILELLMIFIIINI